MKNLIVMVVALVSLTGLAAKKNTNPCKALDEARAAFNKQEGEVFRGAKAADYRTLAAAERPDQAPGAALWVLALPLKRDARVRFIAAEFKDGQFVKGEMRKLGLKPEALDAQAFSALRSEFPVLAIRTDATGKDRPCAFYPAGKVKDTQKNDLIRFGVNVHVDPIGRYVEGLCGIDRALGVDMKGVRYVWSLTTPDGDVLEVGAKGKGDTDIVLLRRELEKLHPGKKGLYSDRDIVDMYCEGTITYRPVK